MPCSNLRRVVGLSATACALSLLAAVVPACTRTVAVTYPGSNVAKYPWRTCGMPCENAFQELADSHTADGKQCKDLITRTDVVSGTDDRAQAAALYDSAILLVLRGKDAEASDRFARAEALDPDPDLRRAAACVRGGGEALPRRAVAGSRPGTDDGTDAGPRTRSGSDHPPGALSAGDAQGVLTRVVARKPSSAAWATDTNAS